MHYQEVDKYEVWQDVKHHRLKEDKTFSLVHEDLSFFLHFYFVLVLITVIVVVAWFSALGIAGLTIGLDDLQVLFKPKHFSESIIKQHFFCWEKKFPAMKFSEKNVLITHFFVHSRFFEVTAQQRWEQSLVTYDALGWEFGNVSEAVLACSGKQKLKGCIYMPLLQRILPSGLSAPD